ncbi:MAG TPA: carboxypeptidase regulatory-like domain-containing protein [Bryobacteraceae bacterium]
MRLAIFGLAALCAIAQETVQYASVSGRVTDPTGAIIEGATVTARQTETNRVRSAMTDNDGRFRFSYLPVGPYEITIEHPGFAEARHKLTLTVGGAFDLPVALQLQESTTNITVQDNQAALEAARHQIAGTIEQTEVRNLPLNGRNFLDLTLLVPGVSPTNTASTQLFAETSAVPGQGISVASQRNFSNSLVVDGLSANDDAAGLSSAFFGLDVVNELQVVTSGAQAEFGRALAGYINVVTKSGTNALHGDLYGYFRNQRWNAANPLLHSTLPLTQAQYGASVGGPVIHDRTFYFANFEQRQLNQTGLITISQPNVSAVNAGLDAAGYRGPRIATGLYPNPVHLSNFLGKLDHEISNNDQFSARYSLYNVDSENSRGAGALNAASAAAGLNDFDQTLAISNIAGISANTVNETRGQITLSNLEAQPNDPIGPTVSIAGVATFGTLSGSPTRRRNALYEIADNLSHRKGAHALRTGVDFLYNDLTITYPQSARGNYSFSSLANFQRGIYNNSGFTQSFGNPVVGQTNPNVGFYVQDEWQALPRLTLNAGIRYDLQFLKTIATDRNNISPRLGFAWSPLASRRMVVRGSFGLFYDRVPLRALANALLSSGNTTELTDSTFITASLSPGQAGAPRFPAILPGLPANVLVNYTTMGPHIQNAYSEQGSFEIERQLGESTVLSASYQHVRGRHLLISLNRNTPVCVSSGTNNGCRPNPAYGNNRQYSSAADSQYDGLSISFRQRPSRWGSYRVSYTYSKALDDVGEFFFSSPMDNFNIRQDWARSDDDQRHRLMFDGILHSPIGPAATAWERLSHGFQLSGSLTYYSALPFNITTGANTVQGTSARPILGGVYIGRNVGSGFDFFNVNARLSRTFPIGEHWRVTAIAEAFNALNHRNNLIPNGTFGLGAYPSNPAPGFGQPSAVADARTFQLALRVSF